MRTPHRPVLLLLSLLALGCASVRPTTPPAPAAGSATAPAAEAAGGIPLADDIRWVAESAEYEAACRQAFAQAQQRLEQLAAGRAAGSWAVSVDADETVLGNVQYEIERYRAGLGFDPVSWREWVARRAAIAVPGARELLARVRELGGLVVVVTNRKDDERADTEANLRALGIPYDVVLTRSTDREKEPRWAAIEQGTAGLPAAEIVLWLGDNIEDFPGLDQSLRGAPAPAFAPFGERYILLPNPMYGSWKP